MKIEKIETVNIYNGEGKPIEVGNHVIILFNTETPDVIGVFLGLNNRNMMGVSCSNGAHWFKQTSIKDIKVFE